MSFLTIGVSYKTTPIEIREKIGFSEPRVMQALPEIQSLSSIEECLILSTCNRVEIYTVTENPSKTVHDIKEFFADFHGIDPFLLEPHYYVFDHEDSLTHGFRVASGLDSMVLGESQILGQIKEAFRMATEAGTIGSYLNRYFNRVFYVAKRVRTETEIASKPVSVSYVAVLLAKKIFGDLLGRRALLVGAGKMGELAATHLKAQGSPEIWVTNRSYERAQSIAKSCEGQVIHFSDFVLSLPKVDVVITSTGSETYLLRTEHIREAMQLRKNRPLFIIDIAVPRNVDPEVNSIPNVYLYDLDDLQAIVESNLKERKSEAQKAEILITHEVQDFSEKLKALALTPTIQLLAGKFDRIRRQELEKAFGRLKELSAADKTIVEACTQAIINKILHDPLLALKTEQKELTEQSPGLSEILQKVFRLDEIR